MTFNPTSKVSAYRVRDTTLERKSVRCEYKMVNHWFSYEILSVRIWDIGKFWQILILKVL
jgi:hypothetical protein